MRALFFCASPGLHVWIGTGPAFRAIVLLVRLHALRQSIFLRVALRYAVPSLSASGG